jgi:Ca2+-transporting ATPase
LEINETSGLDDLQIEESRKLNGKNILTIENNFDIFSVLKDVLTEPIFLILVFTSGIYFFVGQINEGIIMIVALILVSGISFFQENRSRSAVQSLKKLAELKIKVLRNGNQTFVISDDLVVGDIFFLEDGNTVPADSTVLQQHDFAVNESILTGESIPVYKQENSSAKDIFRGTHVVSGSCKAVVTATGTKTAIGKIGVSMATISNQKTPLQIQIRSFTLSMVIFGIAAFVLVCVVAYIQTAEVTASLLKGLTLAMSVLPEEIPVAFSTFMAMGAYHLYKKGVIAKSPFTVETLGAATVICTDKTGTITQNRMDLAAIYDYDTDTLINYTAVDKPFNTVLEFAMWSSEPEPFDKMEVTIHELYSKVCREDLRAGSTLIGEYPLAGVPPYMTHIFKLSNGAVIIAAKGAVEAILKQTNLDETAKNYIFSKVKELTSRGYRVIGVGNGSGLSENFPESQDQISLQFLGLLAFYDPPKPNIAETLTSLYQAGIDLKMITGDNLHTAIAIAVQSGMKHETKAYVGSEIMEMDLPTLRKEVKTCNVFARMFPEAKLKVIEALKDNGEIVAMTGDGVNDGPALKSAHIGIAMGLGGSELAKSASGLILMDDDLKWMTDAVAIGRKIYYNLKKAIRYIISIHIPIISIVAVPLFFSWKYSDIFSPVHVIFLELVMGPTCSVIYENEPLEKGIMDKPPRKITENLFSLRELSLSIIQGIIISVACLGMGFYFMHQGAENQYVRTIIFTVLIFCNFILTLENRSFYHPITVTLRYKNYLIPIILSISMIILFTSIYYQPVRSIFKLSPLSFYDIIFCFIAASVSVMWVELYKLNIRTKSSVMKTITNKKS